MYKHLYITQERHPLYPGAVLTKEESDLLIMEYCIRHNISDVGLEELLLLLNSHLPEKLKPSKYKYLQNFPKIANMNIFYYCPTCFELLNFNNTGLSTCVQCQKEFLQKSLKRNENYFVYIPLKEQLSDLLSGPLFFELNRESPNDDMLSDITSGTVYKTLRQKEIISNYDISIQWNADGVQTFKSSKVSMCPVQVSINELDFRTRKKHILLCGLWAAARKPVLHLFLKPFIDELKELHETGFECLPTNYANTVTIRVHTIVAPVDSVERCALQYVHQYNGACGCSFCLHPGERIPYGKGHTRVYRGTEHAKRTLGQHTRDAIAAEETQKVVNGVKGISPLMQLPIFNVINSFPPEYMHSVLLGVVKLFLIVWLDSKNSQKPWYFGNKSQILDNRLSKILAPCEVTRIPRSVDNIKLWKALEFKNFLVYFSLPCLKGLLPQNFLKHWSLLVYAIRIFDSDKIELQPYKNATRAIRHFVLNVEELYGKEFMKYNVHLLLHIPQAVKNFGAVWAWSAFPYESNNSVLRNMLHNSQAIVHQICKSYLRYQSIKYRDTFDKPNCSAIGKKLLLQMQQKYRKRSGRTVSDENLLILYGTGKMELLLKNWKLKGFLDKILKTKL